MIPNSPDLWRAVLPRPQADGHKYDRGYAVVLGGGIASTGAAKIAARNALRAGAGLVSIACDSEALPAYAAELEAVMTKRCDDLGAFETLIADAHVTAVLLGPAAGVTPRTREAVLAALALAKPCVLDADALTVFADAPETLFSRIQSPTILTPHAGEFARLFGAQDDALAAAKRSHAVVVLKGAETIIAAPDGRCVVNHHASPYLATAGSGDALAGIITGLLAQDMEAFDAACAAVWMHGEVGIHFGAGLIAEDIADGLPAVLHRLCS